MADVLEELRTAIIEGEEEQAVELTRRALQDGVAATVIADEGLTEGLAEVGRLFEEGEYFVPEMLLAASAVEDSMSLLRPALALSGYESAGKVVLGSVKGDLHDIGKKLVGMMMEGAGFEVTDLGVDVPAEAFVEAAREEGVKIVGLSALLTTTVPALAKTVSAMRDSGVDVVVMVGGAAVNQQYADQMGADGFADNASKAAVIARELTS